MMRLRGLETWLWAIGSVLNETHKSAIGVYKGPPSVCPMVGLVEHGAAVGPYTPPEFQLLYRLCKRRRDHRAANNS